MTPADVTDDLATAYVKLKADHAQLRAHAARLEARVLGAEQAVAEVMRGAGLDVGTTNTLIGRLWEALRKEGPPPPETDTPRAYMVESQQWVVAQPAQGASLEARARWAWETWVREIGASEEHRALGPSPKVMLAMQAVVRAVDASRPAPDDEPDDFDAREMAENIAGPWLADDGAGAPDLVAAIERAITATRRRFSGACPTLGEERAREPLTEIGAHLLAEEVMAETIAAAKERGGEIRADVLARALLRASRGDNGAPGVEMWEDDDPEEPGAGTLRTTDENGADK